MFYASKSYSRTVVFLCHPGFGGTSIVPKKGGGCFCISGRKTQAFLPKTLRFYDAGISTVKMTRLSKLSAEICPPWRVTISFAMARPSPAPPLRVARAESAR